MPTRKISLSEIPHPLVRQGALGLGQLLRYAREPEFQHTWTGIPSGLSWTKITGTEFELTYTDEDILEDLVKGSFGDLPNGLLISPGYASNTRDQNIYCTVLAHKGITGCFKPASANSTRRAWSIEDVTDPIKTLKKKQKAKTKEILDRQKTIDTLTNENYIEKNLKVIAKMRKNAEKVEKLNKKMKKCPDQIDVLTKEIKTLQEHPEALKEKNKIEKAELEIKTLQILIAKGFSWDTEINPLKGLSLDYHPYINSELMGKPSLGLDKALGVYHPQLVKWNNQEIELSQNKEDRKWIRFLLAFAPLAYFYVWTDEGMLGIGYDAPTFDAMTKKHRSYAKMGQDETDSCLLYRVYGGNQLAAGLFLSMMRFPTGCSYHLISSGDTKGLWYPYRESDYTRFHKMHKFVEIEGASKLWILNKAPLGKSWNDGKCFEWLYDQLLSNLELGLHWSYGFSKLSENEYVPKKAVTMVVEAMAKENPMEEKIRSEIQKMKAVIWANGRSDEDVLTFMVKVNLRRARTPTMLAQALNNICIESRRAFSKEVSEFLWKEGQRDPLKIREMLIAFLYCYSPKALSHGEKLQLRARDVQEELDNVEKNLANRECLIAELSRIKAEIAGNANKE